MAQRAFLGVDIGTSSSKGVLVSPAGTVLRSATRAHAVSRPAPGHVEMDGDLWWNEFVELATELTAPGDVTVAAVGVSGMGPCVLLTDDDDVPLRPAILYGVDTRAVAQIANLDAELGREKILRRCGSVLTSQAVGPKLRWVRDTEPHVWRRARRWYTPASWLVRRLTGEYVLDHHSASQSTPLLDRHTQSWYEPWAAVVAEHLELPLLRWAGEQAGVTREVVGGIPAAVPVITGTIDAWSEAVSVGAQTPGDLMLMYGTTMFLIATVTEPVTSEVMWGTTGALPGTFNLAGGMATSGALTAWVRDLTGAVPYAELLAEAGRSGVGARGLLVLPYFAGERTPVLDPRARGVIAGLTLTHGRGDLYRGMLEATAYGVRHNVEALSQAGVRVERVVAVGGGTQGGLWTQVVSDVTGLEQIVRRTTIGASYGSAFLAAGLVGPADIDSWNPVERVVRPDAAAASTYDELYQHYRELYPSTRGIVHALAAFQEQSAEASTIRPASVEKEHQ